MASKKQQVAEVVEGLGLGLVALGRPQVSAKKLDVEFAFTHAWQEWSHTGAYPSIGSALKPDNEFWIGVNDSASRKWPYVTWRRDSGKYEISLRDDRTPEECARAIGSRPVNQWITLAKSFIERLDEMVAQRETTDP